MKSQQREQCVVCGELNELTLHKCWRCGHALPWAQNFVTEEYPNPEEEPILDARFKKWGWLPERDLKCRYCHRTINITDRICEHCGSVLVSIHTDDYQLTPFAQRTRGQAFVALGLTIFCIVAMIYLAWRF